MTNKRYRRNQLDRANRRIPFTIFERSLPRTMVTSYFPCARCVKISLAHRFPTRDFGNHSGAKVQFYRLYQRYEPRQQRLMGRMLNVRVEGCFVLELH